MIGVDGGRRISIHALREEGDSKRDILFLLPKYFYPRPPRGGRLLITSSSRWIATFLSTPSARRATLPGVSGQAQRGISIHALREEGDTLLSKILPRLSIFLSTPSARRATILCSWDESLLSDFYPRPPRGGRRWPAHRGRRQIPISIHALREEGDGLDLERGRQQ